MLNTNLFLAIIIILPLGGCLLHPPYERAAVVIYNQTTDKISYSISWSDSWSDPANVKSHDADFFFQYDIKNAEDPLPGQLQAIRFARSACEVLLNRKQLEQTFTRDPNGRKGWNLYITEKLLKQHGC